MRCAPARPCGPHGPVYAPAFPPRSARVLSRRRPAPSIPAPGRIAKPSSRLRASTTTGLTGSGQRLASSTSCSTRCACTEAGHSKSAGYGTVWTATRWILASRPAVRATACRSRASVSARFRVEDREFDRWRFAGRSQRSRIDLQFSARIHNPRVGSGT